MGLLSIFQRNKQTAATPGRPGRATKAAARQAPPANSSNPAESAEAVRDARARARRRLMGATVLLLVGVIGFPLLFETQPRPIPVDLPIEIPARNAAGADGAAPRAHGGRAGPTNSAVLAPAGSPPAASAIAPESVSYDARPAASSASTAQPGGRSAFASLAAALTPTAPRHGETASASAATAVASAPPIASVPALAAERAPQKPPAASVDGGAARAGVATASRPAAPARVAVAAVVPTPAPALPPAATTAAGAQAKDAEPATANRFVVQIGAFADDNKLHEVRSKVEKIGLKTYTQAVETPAGKRVRVRVGPYPTKAEADKVAGRIKADGLPAAVLAL